MQEGTDPKSPLIILEGESKLLISQVIRIKIERYEREGERERERSQEGTDSKSPLINLEWESKLLISQVHVLCV